jgi:hypothetical protein
MNGSDVVCLILESGALAKSLFSSDGNDRKAAYS